MSDLLVGYLLVRELSRTQCRLEVEQPDRLLVVLGEERLADQVGIALAVLLCLLLVFGLLVALSRAYRDGTLVEVMRSTARITSMVFVILIGAAFGWRLGTATVLFYLAQGAMGLPVFAGTPEKGIGLAYMAGPTGGYLLGFAASARGSWVCARCPGAPAWPRRSRP